MIYDISYAQRPTNEKLCRFFSYASKVHKWINYRVPKCTSDNVNGEPAQLIMIYELERVNGLKFCRSGQT